MELSVSSWSLSKLGCQSIEEIFIAAKRNGFTNMEMDLDDNYYVFFDYRSLSEEEVYAHFAEVKKLADKHGVTINQTHIPYAVFPTYLDDSYFELVKKGIAATSALGAKYAVIHPFPFPLYKKRDFWVQERAFSLKWFKRLIPCLEQYGVVCCLENIYDWDNSEIRHTGFSNAKNLAELVQELGDNFGTCLDTGHYHLYGGTQEQAIREFGKTLKVLHIHDCYGIKDDHTIPMLGSIDWSNFVPTLREVGYEGVLNMELKPYLYMESDIGFAFAKEIMKSLIK